ncbi:hypothetical protein F511_23638 [Dorcoceras hygrometricum]|uniref:Senescence regulator n=1 Tax=Dorcoceras hygrometricum TaxID=472368 RepID=A0A2Z7AJR0_9LAMI|nr:hypothetical protein F511_23638 [Dorcoceras hygrometricum]
MAEELQESEVVFPENDNEDDPITPAAFNESVEPAYNTGIRKKKKTKMIDKRTSVPVKIPGNCSWLGYVAPELDCDDGEIVPPHVITARRMAGKMIAFSVCTGNGGTLKGRNIREVRNSILRMTGFLET